MKSKTFDLTAEFDLTNTTATRIEFRVANKTIVYDISEETLMSEACASDESIHVTIRILVDWGQLELFVDGDVKLVSMELHELKRIW